MNIFISARLPVTFALLSIISIQAHAVAECEGSGPPSTKTDQVTGNTLSNLLSNKLVCAWRQGGAANPMQRWSEIHNGNGGGQLGEHGRGTTDPAGSYDANIGNWIISGDAVTYNYTGDGVYTYTIWRTAPGGTYYFCDSTANISAITQNNGTKIQSIPASSDTNPCGW